MLKKKQKHTKGGTKSSIKRQVHTGTCLMERGQFKNVTRYDINHNTLKWQS